MLADGTYDIPPGKVVEVTTYLEMRSPPSMPAAEMPPGQSLRRITAPDPAWYRDLFLRVGGADWLWFSRLRLSQDALGATLADPAVEVYAVEHAGRAEGLLELDFREPRACELAYFGLTPALIGKGVGRALMSFATHRAFKADIDLFHVHTCQLDSPQALGFYRRSGFTPFRQSVTVGDDPRLTGDLPPTAGPHIPLFTP
ncbi:GNAT family N-acetyltransferase [Marinovum sp.]|uniref:GNAT family N-acetyltransferase n=1 Tax=Marinovum sp. TaxID=2024839 RepID=UPI002B2663D4|nr:GNAT family N-acetyltransferase [Marinovum sp.]